MPNPHDLSQPHAGQEVPSSATGDAIMTCHICKKEMGQLPQRCPGHYEGLNIAMTDLLMVENLAERISGKRMNTPATIGPLFGAG